MTTRKILLLAFTAIFAVAGCNKKKDDPPAPTPPGGGGGGQQVDFSPADATLAVNHSTIIISGTEMPGASATAVFMDTWNSVNAGTVTMNDSPLEYGQFGYAMALPPQDFNFNATVNWQVSGGNGFPAFTTSVSGNMPTVGPLTSSTTIQAGQPFTVSVNGVTNAHYVVFGLRVGDTTFGLNTAGNATSNTFPATMTNGLEPGDDVQIIITAVRRNRTMQEGKKIDALKRTLRTYDLTVQ